MIAGRLLPLLFIAAVCAPSDIQQVKYIDLTALQQRTKLRFPPAPPPKCDADGNCTGEGIGSASVGDGAPDPRDPRGLGIYVLRVSPTDIDPDKPFEVEFRVLNTGRVKIDLPVSPHLSDLQPDDASLSFSYFSLTLLAEISAEPYAETRSFGSVDLYGSPDHKGTMVSLEPGEWIQVKANVKLSRWPTAPIPGRVFGGLWLRKNTSYPLPGDRSIAIENLYPNITQMSPETWLPVYLLAPQAPADK